MSISLFNNEPWVAAARCGSLEPAEADRMFFGDGRAPADAIRMCQACPVQPQCRAFANRERVEFGFWGAESAQQRLHRSTEGSAA